MSDTEKQMTPLQELIDKLEDQIEPENSSTDQCLRGVNSGLKIAVQIAQSLLPKEKQGIIEAYYRGIREMTMDDDKEAEPPTGEYYFTEKYTQ